MSNVLEFGMSLENALKERQLNFSKNDEIFFDELKTEMQIYFKDRFLSLKLFGSRSRGTNMPLSDWDFLVFIKDDCDFENELPLIDKIRFDLTLKHKTSCISISPLSESQFNKIEIKFPGIHAEMHRDTINL